MTLGDKQTAGRFVQRYFNETKKKTSNITRLFKQSATREFRKQASVPALAD
jgi:hypothetical protein